MPETITINSLMTDVTPDNFEIGSAVIAYGAEKLGGTDDAPTISVEPVFRETRCNQNGENAVAVFITGYNIKVKAKFKEITKALAVLIPGGKLTSADFGKNLLAEGTGKELTVVGTKRSFKFPKAVAISPWDYAIDGVEEHGIELEFTCYQGADGTFLEQVAAGV